MPMATVSASEARANFSKVGDEVFRTGQPVTVFKNSKPWLIISPARQVPEYSASQQDALYEEEFRRIVERGELEYEAGAYSDLGEFLAKHPRKAVVNE